MPDTTGPAPDRESVNRCAPRTRYRTVRPMSARRALSLPEVLAAFAVLAALTAAAGVVLTTVVDGADERTAETVLDQVSSVQMGTASTTGAYADADQLRSIAPSLDVTSGPSSSPRQVSVAVDGALAGLAVVADGQCRLRVLPDPLDGDGAASPLDSADTTQPCSGQRALDEHEG